jgi:hypothetical protein
LDLSSKLTTSHLVALLPLGKELIPKQLEQMIPHLIISDKQTLVPYCCIQPVPAGRAIEKATISPTITVQLQIHNKNYLAVLCTTIPHYQL